MSERNARTTTEQVPSMGRIVVYHHIHSPQNPASESPAVIQAVREDGSVRLFVFAQGGPELVEGVLEGEAEGQWSWPVIVNVPPPPVLAGTKA